MSLFDSWCVEFQASVVKRMRGRTQLDFACYCLGLQGELSELGPSLNAVSMFRTGQAPDEATRDLIHEIGDVLWYCGAICEMSDVSLRDAYTKSTEWVEVLKDLRIDTTYSFACRAVGAVSEAVKKHLAHGKGLLSGEIEVAIARVLACLRHWAVIGDSCLKTAALLNDQKLARRYPDGFKEGGGNR